MGKDILTAHQKAILELAVTDPEISTYYYLTGGTALTEFYLKHRLSEDLDFFTESDVDIRYLKNLFARHENTLDLTGVKTKEMRGLVFFYLSFSDKTELKVDFVNHPYSPIEKGISYKQLAIDSIFDIALNKLYVMSDRSRARDFVDLYFILTTQGISLDQVYSRIPDKFHGVSFDIIELGRKLTYFADLSDYPTMLVPFDREDMIDFYLSEAKKLEPKIFK